MVSGRRGEGEVYVREIKRWINCMGALGKILWQRRLCLMAWTMISSTLFEIIIKDNSSVIISSHPSYHLSHLFFPPTLSRPHRCLPSSCCTSTACIHRSSWRDKTVSSRWYWRSKRCICRFFTNDDGIHNHQYAFLQHSSNTSGKEL